MHDQKLGNVIHMIFYKLLFYLFKYIDYVKDYSFGAGFQSSWSVGPTSQGQKFVAAVRIFKEI